MKTMETTFQAYIQAHPMTSQQKHGVYSRVLANESTVSTSVNTSATNTGLVAQCRAIVCHFDVFK